MQILITTKWTYTQGPDVTFNCPKCGTQEAQAQTQGTEEKNSLFWLIPLFTTAYTKLTCGNCSNSFKLTQPLEEVENLAPEVISQNLEKSVPFLIKFCIVSSIALFIIPFVGLIFGGIGLAATAKKPTGWKKAAIVGLVLSLLPILAMILALVFGE
jgi:predicted nucleic-acid-binding Zn-ribbon protein